MDSGPIQRIEEGHGRHEARSKEAIMAECKGCGEEIEWIATTEGKRMPVNPGKVVVVTQDGKVVTGQVPHWATCPRAADFRKKGPKE